MLIKILNLILFFIFALNFIFISYRIEGNFCYLFLSSTPQRQPVYLY